MSTLTTNKLLQHFALLGPPPIIEKCGIILVKISDILYPANVVRRLTMQAARQAAILHIINDISEMINLYTFKHGQFVVK